MPDKRLLKNGGMSSMPYLRPQQEKGAWMKKFYDADRKAFLGRTGGQWVQLLLFYIVFFSLLAAMFGTCMYALLASCSLDHPTYQLEYSLIGTTPGMGYRPYPQEIPERGSLIWYRSNEKGNLEKWVRSMDGFLNEYTNRSREGYENRVSCDNGRPAPPGKVCDVAVDGPQFGPCTSANQYSYNRSSPCIFLKLNKIFNWMPEFYTKDNVPSDMSDELKQKIQHSNESLIWVECNGMDPMDRENIGPISYYPQQGFSGVYYPFTNKKGYVSPLVAAHFQRPERRVLIRIECRAWAKNIVYKRDKGHPEGAVHIELLIDG